MGCAVAAGRRQRRALFMGIALLAALAPVTTWLRWNRLERPLERMAGAMEQAVATGTMDHAGITGTALVHRLRNAATRLAQGGPSSQ